MNKTGNLNVSNREKIYFTNNRSNYYIKYGGY